MRKQKGRVVYKLKELLERNSITVERKGENKSAYITHLIQHYNGWTDDFLKWAEAKFGNEQNSLLEDDGGLPNLFPVDYSGVPFPPPPPGEEEFTFIDLFAGIGGFRIAMQKQGGRCVFSSEWDVHSQRTYFANFGEVPFGDITKPEVKAQIPTNFDLLCGGFPCQPFSLAGVSKKNSLGKKHGFLDETQGTLFYDIAEIIERHRPKAFLLENVKNLKSHDKGKTYTVIKETLEKLNYKIFDQIVDAKYYVPQHRERIFIVGFNQDLYPENIEFTFPTPPKEIKAIRKILEETPDQKYTLTDHLWTYLQNYAKKHALKGNGFGFGLVDLNSYTRTLSARYHKDGSEILIPQGKNKNPRRLTSGECKALMGYPEKFKIENIGVSQTQIYRQFGNSVAVPVVTDIAKNLIRTIQREDGELLKNPTKKNRKKTVASIP